MGINQRKGLYLWIIAFFAAAALTGWSGYTATQLRAKQQDVAALEQAIDELNVQIERNAREEIRSQALRKEIADLTARKEALADDVLESQLLIEQRDLHRARADAANRAAEEAQKRAQEHEMLAATAENNAMNANEAALEAENNKDAAERRLLDLRATLQDLEGKIRLAESELWDLRSDAAAETEKAQAAIKEEQRAIERIAQLNKEEDDLQARLQELAQAIADEKQNYRQLQADVADAQDAKNQADSARSDAEASLQAATASLEIAKATLTETESRIESNRAQVAELKRDMTDWQQRLSLAESAENASAERTRQLNTEIDKLDVDRERLNGQLSRLRRELDSVRNEIDAEMMARNETPDDAAQADDGLDASAAQSNEAEGAEQ